MRTLWMVAFAAALVACNNGITEETDQDTDVDTDTDTDTDTDSDTDSDTDTDTDTDDGRPNGADVSFVVSPDLGNFGVALLQVEPAEGEFGDDLVATAVKQGKASFELDPAPEDHLTLITEIGVEAAIYLPYAFEDVDGDGAKDPDEPIVGGGANFMVWMETVSGPLVLVGFQPGWNAVNTDFSPIAKTDIPLPASLLPNLTLTGSGTVGASVQNRRLALFEAGSLEDGGAPLPLQDNPLSDPFSFTVEGPPPDEHRSSDPELPGAALELPVVYTDTDGSGDYTVGDADPTTVCSAGETIAVAWLPQPLDAQTAAFYGENEITPGWGGYLVTDLTDAEPVQLSADAMSKLTVGGCDFPE